MASVTVDRMTKVYDDDGADIVAVSDLDIEVRDGEFLVLVGPSGCGKSTTLRCIAGLESVSEGTIAIGDDVVTGKSPRERNIAMVFQNYALYPHMTARENMSFGLKMSGEYTDREIADRVESAAELMGIEPLLEKRPGELSGGQQQRVALGRAIVRDPAVFLMDEPLSNLDAKLRTQMRTELQSLQSELGTTTIYVTHDQTEAMTMADRIAILNDGELQQIGSPLECYYAPANRFVAGFIGSPSMNFLDVTVDGEVLRHDSLTLPVTPSLSDTVGGMESVTLGIRPEDITLESGPTQDADAIEATVDVVEPMGDLSYVYLTVGGTEITATVEGERVFTAGETVTMRFPDDRLHLFETETGEAVRTRVVPEDRSVQGGGIAG
ncbi:sn-glycerol-3-phosphate ABC transporter ATP-binding protein UgpC [Halomicroarcula sp. F13]|uniref:ABC-type D-xylose/L-arabinose transporter n=1 Tax=Haloarcula rubra TaxID=2487747 RepID=A0AAW4PYX9_9EURY|nr:sn-glycerol-3-phosphate ABC transporter ATP-binding protein UgpC [Halomicroarcula rubra]MBX0325483.1 sn-glycerol-3-phosphate ABC transporter ATP-binding protein UgpC [Halomicroarcula rubra]